jgi:endonuclease YncB( thermonuclease family)
MRRRQFIELVGSTTVIGAAASGSAAAAGGRTVETLAFPSTCSFYEPGWSALTDSSLVPVWAERSAENVDEDGDGDAFFYYDNKIPLVAEDGGVVALGSQLVDDDAPSGYDNTAFLLNVWDSHLGGSGTVYWDESNGQYWTLSKFSEFESAAESAGYDVRPSSNIHNDSYDADAVVVPTPADTLSDGELDRFAEFVANGGTLFLHSESDYNNYDQTDNLNDVAERLGLGFRFNDDQVVDDTNNAGAFYQPTTDRLNTDFPYFGSGGGDGTTTYTGTVTSVADGDTVTVDFDGSEKEVRVLGIDTAETSSNQSAERPEEWEGLESLDYLGNWGDKASQYANDTLYGETVEVFYDDNEPETDPFGRHLMYVRYDSDGDGTFDTLYNKEVLETGRGRVYDSSLTKHDEFISAEATARANGIRIWTESDPDNSSEIRDTSVDEVYVPKPGAVTTSSGSIADSRVPVRAESSASLADAPLVGVDDANRVAMVGGLVVNEDYEADEGFAVDTSGYGNFPLLTNLLDSLAGRTGDVAIDGGHGQFGASAALSAEDAAYYMRYLEGQNLGFEQYNDMPNADLSGYRSVLVTPPQSAFTSSEVSALKSFRDGGGSVVLLGSSAASSSARSNLNDLASALGSDLRLSSTGVTDSQNNLNDDDSLPTTSNFDTSFGLFGPYS